MSLSWLWSGVGKGGGHRNKTVCTHSLTGLRDCIPLWIQLLIPSGLSPQPAYGSGTCMQKQAGHVSCACTKAGDAITVPPSSIVINVIPESGWTWLNANLRSPNVYSPPGLNQTLSESMPSQVKSVCLSCPGPKSSHCCISQPCINAILCWSMPGCSLITMPWWAMGGQGGYCTSALTTFVSFVSWMPHRTNPAGADEPKGQD